MTDNQLIKDLKATREALVSRGRCTGILVQSNGKVCLDGAIALATIKGYHYRPGAEDPYQILENNQRTVAVSAALYEHLPEEFKTALHNLYFRTPEFGQLVALFSFNDSDDVTDEDVIGLIDKTLAEAGGL